MSDLQEGKDRVKDTKERARILQEGEKCMNDAMERWEKYVKGDNSGLQFLKQTGMKHDLKDISSRIRSFLVGDLDSRLVEYSEKAAHHQLITSASEYNTSKA